MRASWRASPRRLWAYSYRIALPVAGLWLEGIRTILDRENSLARGQQRCWSGRLVPGPLLTCILVVSGSAGNALAVNGLLEAELQRRHMPFRLTNPMAIPSSDDGTGEWAGTAFAGDPSPN